MHVTAAQCFEAAMLMLFGISWPFAISKTFRTRNVQGVSLLFIALVFIGYLCGLAAKLLRSAAGGAPIPPETYLYAMNAVLVGIEIVLYFRYRQPAGA
jgi:hypothetical protein